MPWTNPLKSLKPVKLGIECYSRVLGLVMNLALDNTLHTRAPHDRKSCFHFIHRSCDLLTCDPRTWPPNNYPQGTNCLEEPEALMPGVISCPIQCWGVNILLTSLGISLPKHRWTFHNQTHSTIARVLFPNGGCNVPKVAKFLGE